MPRLVELEDGSYLSKVYPSKKDRERDRGGLQVRVVEYVVEDELGNKFPEEDPFYRVITTVLDAEAAPARDLAALYHERWEIESAFDELKTHLRGKDVVLRSKTPDLVRQEFYGLLLAHYAVRAIMHEAALQADVDADELSFVHSVRVIRRKLQAFRGHPASDDTQGGSPFPPSA